MFKRLTVLLLLILIFCFNPCSIMACNEQQTDLYVTQILFGDNALQYESDDNVRMLLDALYLCGEQSDMLGQDKINSLKRNKVKGVPSLEKINISSDFLLKCSHNAWEYEYEKCKGAQDARRNLLRNTVNKVFDFGTLNNLFNADSGKCNSFAAFLYYSHILCDYLADDPDKSDASFKGYDIPSYKGEPYIRLNGNVPQFSEQDKKSVLNFAKYSQLDAYERAGVAFVNISYDDMKDLPSTGNLPDPSGWNQESGSYGDFMGSRELFNRCHLIGHQLSGIDRIENLITGTRYLNMEGMRGFEISIATYLKNYNNHVLYRATPVYKGDNLIASGVQLEAYSIEDEGVLHFNVYCYNVQPGVDINYANGKSEKSDFLYKSEGTIPFVTFNPTDQNPDLIYAINKHLEILFEDQKDSGTYQTMMSKIEDLDSKVCGVINSSDSSSNQYAKIKKYEYEYFEILKNYVPILLEKEEFFSKTFK